MQEDIVRNEDVTVVTGAWGLQGLPLDLALDMLWRHYIALFSLDQI